jgi:hypothetical protein
MEEDIYKKPERKRGVIKDHKLISIEAELNSKLAYNKINASKLINQLLRDFFEKNPQYGLFPSKPVSETDKSIPEPQSNEIEHSNQEITPPENPVELNQEVKNENEQITI